MSALAAGLTTPLAAAAVLLVLAGAPKVVRPHDLRRALAGAGLRVPAAAVRVGGGLEVVLGLVALAVTSRVLAGLVAASYALFTAFVLLALRRGWALSTCGCFGKEDTPPSRLHAALTGAVALGAATAAVAGTPALLPALGDGPAAGLPLLAGTALVAWLLYLGLTALPQLGVRVAQVAADREGTLASAPSAPTFRLLPLVEADRPQASAVPSPSAPVGSSTS